MRNNIDNRGFIEERDDTTDSLIINSGNVTIVGTLILSGSTSFTSTSIGTQLNPTWIPDPGPNRDANTTALTLYNAGEAISVWTPTALRNIDPSDAPSSMAFTIIKLNTGSFGISVSGSGWNGNGTLYNSATAASGSWLVRLDKPNKIIISTPGA